MKSLFNNIYNSRRVFITGHTGFKGSWLSTWLHLLGAKVIGYALKPPTDPNMYEILDLNGKLDSITGDIRDFEKLKQVLSDFKPEIIFHLAAQPIVRLSYADPRETFETNIIGTVNVIEAARKVHSVKAIVNVTSDKCYENKEWVYGYRENDPMGGHDPYSSSKGCAELVTSAYRNSFFYNKESAKEHYISLSSARAGNVIGGGDWSVDRLIPDCIRALNSEGIIEIRNPDATRPWQHVLEPLSGYLWLAAEMWNNPESYNSAWNFGPDNDDNISVEEIAKSCIEHWGKGSYKTVCGANLHEARLLNLDISKARYYLKWKPLLKAKEALLDTVLWYKAFYSGYVDMYQYTIEQIDKYVAKASESGVKWGK